MSIYRLLTERLGESEFNYAYSVSLKHRYVYVEVAKAGCTTTKSVLGQWEFIGVTPDIPRTFLDNVHMHVVGTPFVKPFQLGEQIFNQIIARDDFVKVAFVRNPFTRILSAYLNKIRPQTWEFQGILQEATALGLTDPSIELSFTNFLKSVHSLAAKEVLNRHWRQQHFQLYFEAIPYNFIGKFEKLDKDLEVLAAVLGINAPSERQQFGHQTHASDRIDEFFNDESIGLVRGLYKKDFESFGYDFELPTSKL